MKGSNSKENVMQDKLPIVVGISKPPSNDTASISTEKSPQSATTNQ